MLTIFGVIITVVYITFIVVLRRSSLTCLCTMPLNEFGDFLAGVFGPLMLFWLILGYVQQQMELRQNTKALDIQARELGESVKQYKKMVSISEAQMTAEKNRHLSDSQPVFSIIDISRNTLLSVGFSYKIKFCNTGKFATQVKTSTQPKIGSIEGDTNLEKVIQYSEHFISWKIITPDKTPEKLELIIECLDSSGNTYKKSFFLRLNQEKKYYELLPSAKSAENIVQND